MPLSVSLTTNDYRMITVLQPEFSKAHTVVTTPSMCKLIKREEKRKNKNVLRLSVLSASQKHSSHTECGHGTALEANAAYQSMTSFSFMSSWVFQIIMANKHC